MALGELSHLTSRHHEPHPPDRRPTDDQHHSSHSSRSERCNERPRHRPDKYPFHDMRFLHHCSLTHSYDHDYWYELP